MKLTDLVLTEFTNPLIAGPIVNEMARELLQVRDFVRLCKDLKSDRYALVSKVAKNLVIGEKE